MIVIEFNFESKAVAFIIMFQRLTDGGTVTLFLACRPVAVACTATGNSPTRSFPLHNACFFCEWPLNQITTRRANRTFS